jgi:hypothetical protein
MQVAPFLHRRRAGYVGIGKMTMMLIRLFKRVRRGLRRFHAVIAAARLRRLRNELICHGGFVIARDASPPPVRR